MSLDCFGAVGERLRRIFGVLKNVELTLSTQVVPVVDVTQIASIPDIVTLEAAATDSSAHYCFNDTGFDLFVTHMNIQSTHPKVVVSAMLLMPMDAARPPSSIEEFKLWVDVDSEEEFHFFEFRIPIVIPSGWAILIDDSNETGTTTCWAHLLCTKRTPATMNPV